jgi:hypothetical protein
MFNHIERNEACRAGDQDCHESDYTVG